jgi:glycosyltransferase involved in cell wall biosynthesis
MRIDQWLPAFHRGDAIGDEARYLRHFFRQQGFDSEIYCLDRDEGLEEESRLFREFRPGGREDIVILHYALPSPLSYELIRLSSRRVIIHHNVTSPEFFEGFSEEMVRIARLGKRELGQLAPFIDLGLADSEFNRLELESLGFRRTAVLPLFIDFERYQRPANPFLRKIYRDGRTNILFVGRVVPNKKIEDLIKVTFYFKKYISPLVRLIVVGKTTSLPKYFDCLIKLVDDFYLQPEEVLFTGHVPDEDLYAYYQVADVFLSLSEHEGFCLPLLESMIFNLPVIAYAAGAVASTLDGAGILLKQKKVAEIAELVALLSQDEKLRSKIICGQRERLERFRSFPREKYLLSLLESLHQDQS